MRITGWLQALTPLQRMWFPYIALALGVFAAYANILHNAFVLDDWHLVVYNDYIKHWAGLYDIFTKLTNGPYYRPMQSLFYLLIYQGFGLSEAAFHGGVILLHIANTCLMYRLGCRLGFYRRASFAAALLWGVHPLWIEIMTVVTGAADLLEILFCMLALLVLLPEEGQKKPGAFAPRRSGAEQIPGAFAPRKLFLAMLLFILALGSKEAAVVFPALVVCTLFLISKERLRPATYLRTWPLWLLAIAYLVGVCLCPALVSNVASYMYQDNYYVEFYKHNFFNRILTCFATLPVYLGYMIMPVKLRPGWIFPVFTTVWDWHVIAGAVIVIAALAQIIWSRGKRGLPLTWGLLWFAAAFSPYTGILKPIDGQLSQHWIYLPMIGLFLGMSQTLVGWMDTLRFKKAPVIAAGLVALFALGLGTKTHLQDEVYLNLGSLYECIIQDDPSESAYYGLGVYYFGQKEYAKAAEQWRTVETYNHYSAGLNKGGGLFMHNGLAYIYLGVLSGKDNVSLQDVTQALPSSKHIPEAIEELRLAEEIDPHYCCASMFLSGIYYYLGDKVMGDYYKELTEKNAPTNELKNASEILH